MNISEKRKLFCLINACIDDKPRIRKMLRFNSGQKRLLIEICNQQFKNKHIFLLKKIEKIGFFSKRIHKRIIIKL